MYCTIIHGKDKNKAVLNIEKCIQNSHLHSKCCRTTKMQSSDIKDVSSAIYLNDYSLQTCWNKMTPKPLFLLSLQCFAIQLINKSNLITYIEPMYRTLFSFFVYRKWKVIY